MGGETFRRLWLLVWKNLILRKRQYIVTAMEIILPTLFAILMAYIRASLRGNNEYNGEKIFLPITEQEMISDTQSRLFGYNSYNNTVLLGFCPDTDEVKGFVNDDLGPLIKNGSRYDNIEIQWMGFNKEEELEAFVGEQGFQSTITEPRLKFALVITDPNAEKVSYKIRLVDDFYDTKTIMPWIIFSSDCTEYDYGVYRYSGFLGLQIMIDKLLTEKMTKMPTMHTVSTTSFPCPGNDGFDFNQLYFFFMPQLMIIGFIFIVPSIVRGIVSEKETGIKELMKMTGIPNWMHWVGWMLNSLIVLIISITLVIVLLFIPFNSEAGGVLKNSDPSIWWFFLFCYAVWATSYCFLISSVFERPTLATTVGIVLWLVTYYGVSLPLESSYSTLSLSSKMLLCLSPNMGLHYGLKVLSAFEAKKGVGAQWKYIAKSTSSVDSLALGHVLLMLVVSSVIYTLLAMYLESILPTKFGVRKPWYFIFMPTTWGFKKDTEQSKDVHTLRSEALASEGSSFEQGSNNLKVGLEIIKLRKEFDDKVAVDDVSFKAYQGQIFCLLGHNGAGKTTTMSVLTGLLSASGGTALIDGKDIRSEMNEIRQNLGLCPQHNLLFSKLTVTEHLKFFGMVKGLSGSEAELQIPPLIQKLHLAEKSDVLAMSLSGGQKRRLSLGCAIIGDSKVLFIDEASSGLDPEARRIIWDLLLEIRGHRTIILSTHFLEECDILGDRIGIMAGGRLQCCGSPGFLKKYYGTGYTLALSLSSERASNEVLPIVQAHVPTAFIKSMSKKESVIELAIVLPSEENITAHFSPMFYDLLSQKERLEILDVGISLTTMDDVFIKVDELSQMLENQQSRVAADNSLFQKSAGERSTGAGLLIQQFWGLMLKKILYSLRRWKLTLSQIVIPIGLMIAAILITNLTYGTTDQTPPLLMTLNSYRDQVILYTESSSSESEKIGSAYSVVVGRSAIGLPPGSNLTSELLRISHSDEESYFQRHLFGAELDPLNLNAMSSSIPDHVQPLSINLVANSMLQYLTGGNSSYEIQITNHPLSSGQREIWDAASPDPFFTEVAPFVVGVLVSIGLALLAASVIVMPIEERKSQCKQLQLMTGVNPFVYWGSAFTWDYFMTLICIGVMVACLYIFEDYTAFTNNGGAGVAFIVMAVYGVGAISFSYLLSLISQTPAGGFAFVTILHIITGVGFAIGVFVLQDDQSLVGPSKVVGWLGRLFPTFGVAKSMMVFAKLSTKNSRCNVLTDEIKAILCKTGGNDFYLPETYQACCDNCKELGAPCFEPTPLLTWSYKEEQLYPSHDYVVPSLPGIGQELVFMGVMAIIYFTILMLVEFGWMKKMLNKIWKQNPVDFISHTNDNDVLEETARVKQLIQCGATTEDSLVVDSFSKSYGNFSAVSRLTFGVHHGECFGLLGVNGAGKTTTFKMLTGDEIISSGDAWLQKNSLQRDRKTFLSQIAYCPQFDGIIGVLSGFEMLQLFARLRGVKGSNVQFEAGAWLDRFGLLDDGKKQCQKYSGGMKRRLSAAMAMVGDPPILLLDEPTSGVDPVSRRQFWSIISTLKNMGKSIILTSHSMEECENLCSRLGIMVNGEMQCMGRVQHLKNKFAQGYTLTIRLRPQVQVEGFMPTLEHQVTSQFNPCILKDQHQNVAQFHIQSTTIRLDMVFERMEKIKNEFKDHIADYQVQQTTLEEVFLSFARKQYTAPREIRQTSAFRKFVASVFGF